CYDPTRARRMPGAAVPGRPLHRLERALSELRFERTRTTFPLFRALLADADFRSGNRDIGMLDRKLAAGELHPVVPESEDDLPLIAAALAHHEQAHRQTATGPAPATSLRSRWGSAGRRNAVRGGSWS